MAYYITARVPYVVHTTTDNQQFHIQPEGTIFKLPLKPGILIGLQSKAGDDSIGRKSRNKHCRSPSTNNLPIRFNRQSTRDGSGRVADFKGTANNIVTKAHSFSQDT